jgi:hypothetical protein
MRVFVLGLINQSGYYHDHPIGRATKTVRHGAQLTPRRQSITRVVSAMSPCSASKPLTPGTRNSHTKAVLRCYECEGEDISLECPTRLNRAVNPSDSPGRTNPIELLRRSCSPGDKPQHVTERGVRKETKNQGNEGEVRMKTAPTPSTPLTTLS